MSSAAVDLTTEERIRAAENPHLGTGPVSIEPFVSQAYLERECEHIFARMWLLAGRTARLQKPGDYFVKNIDCLGKSIVVVRGRDGEVRAFYNVCRHRGTNIANGAGNCKYFTCRFHGWVYDTEGTIRDIPDESQFHVLDKSQLNLDPVHCEVWNGFVFVNFDREPRETLREQLAEFWDDLADYPFEKMVVTGRWGATLKANWKLFQDAFQEGYHVCTVHAGTIGPYFTGRLNPNCRPYRLKLYERNRAMSFSFNPDTQPKPSELFAIKIGQSLSQGAAGTETDAWPGANPAKDPHYSFDINAIFPNWLLDTSNGFFFIHEFWPIDATTTRWEAALHFMPSTKASEVVSQAQSATLLRDAFREDIATSEGSQAGLMSGSLKEINFSDAEITCRHQYEVIERILAEAT